MSAGDGTEYRTHPLFATYIGDYPEQVLVTGTKTGDCPTCPTAHDELEDFPSENSDKYRDLEAILAALDSFDTDPEHFLQTCKRVGVKPIIDPFWKDLPFAHVYRSITPDILHQLYQGVLKHLIKWLISVYGAAEIDARCRRLPPNHNIRIFMNGITTLSRVTGTEHDQICRFLMGLVIDIPLDTRSNSNRVVRATRAILDFLYLAQYPIHTSETLDCLRDALSRFHNNKEVFVDLGIRSHFNIPKVHFMNHYNPSIILFGTLDNYNTEHTERLHIDLAKDAYRATNKKDEYPQMTLWLERREKIMKHDKYILWRRGGCPAPRKLDWVPPGLDLSRQLKLTKHPSTTIRISKLIENYGATFFYAALARFIILSNKPDISRVDLEDDVEAMHFPFATIPVWHRVKYLREDRVTGIISTADSLHVQPARSGKHGKVLPGRFDTALIRDEDENGTRVSGKCCTHPVDPFQSSFKFKGIELARFELCSLFRSRRYQSYLAMG
jgi:hypothetical protein